MSVNVRKSWEVRLSTNGNGALVCDGEDVKMVGERGDRTSVRIRLAALGGETCIDVDLEELCTFVGSVRRLAKP